MKRNRSDDNDYVYDDDDDDDNMAAYQAAHGGYSQQMQQSASASASTLETQDDGTRSLPPLSIIIKPGCDLEPIVEHMAHQETDEEH